MDRSKVIKLVDTYVKRDGIAYGAIHVRDWLGMGNRDGMGDIVFGNIILVPWGLDKALDKLVPIYVGIPEGIPEVKVLVNRNCVGVGKVRCSAMKGWGDVKELGPRSCSGIGKVKCKEELGEESLQKGMTRNELEVLFREMGLKPEDYYSIVHISRDYLYKVLGAWIKKIGYNSSKDETSCSDEIYCELGRYYNDHPKIPKGITFKSSTKYVGYRVTYYVTIQLCINGNMVELNVTSRV